MAPWNGPNKLRRPTILAVTKASIKQEGPLESGQLRDAVDISVVIQFLFNELTLLYM